MLSKLKQLLGVPGTVDSVPWIDVPDLRAQLSDRPPVIIDVRGPDEFDGPLGHIEGAANVPVEAIVAGTADLRRFRNTAVVLVCKTDRRSARAADSLRTSGFTDVAVLRGGMERWNAEGLPVARR